MAETILKHYAPADEDLGIHFKAYHENICTPIIRRSIRDLTPSSEDHVVVYLSAYDPTFLGDLFRQVRETRWKIFSHHVQTTYRSDNIEVHPISQEAWLQALASCRGVIIGGGFEGPSEALYLGKKMLVVPMSNQYEQQCNAAALATLGIPSLRELSIQGLGPIRQWLEKSQRLPMLEFTSGDQLARRVVATAEHLLDSRKGDLRPSWA